MTIEGLISLIREAAEISEPISADTPLISSGLIGSLKVAVVLAAIKAKCGVTLALDEVGADNFDTADQIASVLGLKR